MVIPTFRAQAPLSSRSFATKDHGSHAPLLSLQEVRTQIDIPVPADEQHTLVKNSKKYQYVNAPYMIRYLISFSFPFNSFFF